MLKLVALLTAGGAAVHYGLRRLRCSLIEKDKKLRDHLSEKQIDHMVEDSFPASDPPSTY